MFESDDFDKVLSQLDFPELAAVNLKKKANVGLLTDNKTSQLFKIGPDTCNKSEFNLATSPSSKIDSKIVLDIEKHISECSETVPVKAHSQVREENKTKLTMFELPKQNKRKIINSYFDHQNKRKFPGPAGLLTGALEPKDESICRIELLSQDIDYTQHDLRRDLFESPIWCRLLNDVQSWKLDIDSINAIKQQALSGNLRRRKAQNVTAFVEAVDRCAVDPLIILRDATGSIKCTLHRDAWSTFSQYIVSDCCALILHKPTVLTTGGAFKKHYLNITLSNILAIYSSTVLSEDGRTLPDGYSVIYDDDFTVIKTEKCSDSLDIFVEQNNGAEDLTDDLDSFFSDMF